MKSLYKIDIRYLEPYWMHALMMYNSNHIQVYSMYEEDFYLFGFGRGMKRAQMENEMIRWHAGSLIEFL